MFKSQHTVNDFQIGDCVVPVNKSELTLVIIDILKDKKKMKILKLKIMILLLSMLMNPSREQILLLLIMKI